MCGDLQTITLFDPEFSIHFKYCKIVIFQDDKRYIDKFVNTEQKVESMTCSYSPIDEIMDSEIVTMFELISSSNRWSNNS